MPGIHYLDGNSEDLYNIKRLGSQFSDLVIGAAEARSKKYQYMQQNAIDRTYLGLAQQKAGLEQSVNNQKLTESKYSLQQSQAQDARNQAIMQMRAAQQSPMLGQIATDPVSGPQLWGNVQAAGAAPHMSFAPGFGKGVDPATLQAILGAAINAQLYGTAAQNPGSAAQLAEPASYSPNTTVMPNRQNPMQAYQMPPAQIGPIQVQQHQDRDAALQQRNTQYNTTEDERKRHNLEMEDIADRREYDFGRGVDKRGAGVDISELMRATAAKRNGTNTAPGQVGDISYDDEKAARTAGKKSGDRVYLKGVGLVLLH